MRGAYPSGTVEHLNVQRVSKQLSINEGEGVAGGHTIEEWAGEEGGGVWCGWVEPTIP